MNHPSADTFRFSRATKLMKPVATSALEQTLVLDSFNLAPNKLRVELLGPGFSLFFPKGMQLRLTGLTAPFLTWTEGTFEGDTGYPTPELKWAILTFRDQQPPVLLGFPVRPAALQLRGRAGAWTVSTPPEWEGWVRIAAPRGVQAYPTNTVAQIGQLVQEVRANEALWSEPVPRLVRQSVEDDERGLSVTWEFDRPNALVPPFLAMAKIARSPLVVRTEVRRLNAPTEEGPSDLAVGTTLGVRFPARRIPTGRAMVAGPHPAPFGTASYLDPPSVTELAFANLVSTADEPTRKLAEATYQEFLTEAETVVEPATGQPLLYHPDGRDLDLVAAHALLMQSTLSTQRATSEPNSLLTSLGWRRDWATGRLWGANPKIARRASAIAAVAAAMMPEPERRLEGALFEAGLAAERGLARWRARQGNIKQQTFLEALPEIRRDLYAAPDYRLAPGFGATLLGDLRWFGDRPPVLTKEENRWFLSLPGEANKTIFATLASGYPLAVTAPEGFTISAGFGLTVLRGQPKTAGPYRFELILPAWATPPGGIAELPRFTEVELAP